MPSFKHKPTGKRIFFAHIPRTAGRFVEANLLWKNDFEWDDVHLDNGLGVMSKVNGIEIAHYHRGHYEKYLDVKDIPHFSIVRNPINRFISSSIYIKRVYEECQELMEDPMMFSSMLENMPFEESVNWFRPQVDFMSDKTHIWKFEDCMGKEFFSWLSGIVGIDLEFDDNIEYPTSKDEHYKDSRLEATPKLIHNLKTLYRKDIEQFYPELAA
tara:strand:- start:299 stop:937 length:639 start_codon:yes stop_codon:yes gene_type:complete